MLSPVFTIIGILALIAGSFFLFKTIKIVKQGNTVMATVAENKVVKKSGKGDSKFAPAFYHSVLKYEINGVQYTEESHGESRKPKYEVGEELKIYYNGKNPSEFLIGRETTLNILLYSFNVVFGLTFTVIGLIQFF